MIAKRSDPGCINKGTSSHFQSFHWLLEDVEKWNKGKHQHNYALVKELREIYIIIFAHIDILANEDITLSKSTKTTSEQKTIMKIKRTTIKK